MKTAVHLRMEEELKETVDRLRGDVPREVWIRRAIRERIERIQSPTKLHQKAPDVRP